MIKNFKSYLKSKKGMTLVELLTAMTILMLVLFCFAPLTLSYLQTVNISGDKMSRVQTESGVLQVLLGGGGSKAEYTVPINSVPMQLTSPTTTIDTTQYDAATISSNVQATGLSSRGTQSEDNGLVNLAGGYNTIVTGELGAGSGIRLFPSTLTDDFSKAYITVYGNGINFDNLDYCTLSATGTSKEITLTKGVDYDIEYHPDAAADQTNILLLTVYGGGDKISFETSPLLFKYAGQIYEIQVDAPMMIMVGEKSLKADDDGNWYHYYVSRGELDDDGDLLIHRRVMNTTEDELDSSVSSSTPITLSSAMNDVEWVSADSADNHSKETSGGDSYGYYVMCGDDGQVRRFWKRPNTTVTVDGQQIEVDGNYYWGGDYTYYTDINNDEVETGNRYYTSKETYSTGTEYSYVYRGSHTAGFVLGGYGSLKLMNANTFTINALDSDKTNKATNIYLYLPDGELYYFQNESSSGNNLENYVTTQSAMKTVFDNATDGYDNGTINGVSVSGLNRYWGVNLSTDWRTISDNEIYYTVNNKTRNTNMITLTSVDAINITGSGSAYYSTSSDGAQGYFGSVEYPTSTYNLYCGYIPAVMDAWSNGTSRGSDSAVINTGSDWSSDSDYGTLNSQYSSGFQINTNGFSSWPYWKGNYGILAWTSTTGEVQYGSMQNAYNHDYYKNYYVTKVYKYNNVTFYQYSNVMYAAIGKVFDQHTTIDDSIVASAYLSYIPSTSAKITSPNIYHPGSAEDKQTNITGGEVVDITMSYLSHPLAIARTMNPTDDIIYDYTNERDKNSANTRTFYWNNSREAATYLDCASTMVPAGEDDIPVSMMVGYITGGIAEYTGSGTGNDVFINTVMNNGIVLLRAGTSNTGTHSADNFDSGEDMATDSTGYKLDAESNSFHQFYYLNSRSNISSNPNRGLYNHIGNLGGAMCWFNNKHIQYLSIDGRTAVNGDTTSSSYSYLRSHPLSNTKVNCVTWGTSWSSNPVAMWGTENGTLLSWKCEKYDDDADGNTVTNNSEEKGFNDRNVYAEFQSYQWVDRINGKTFAVHDSRWSGTVGSSCTYGDYNEDNKTQTGHSFSIGSDYYWDFYDSCSRLRAGESYDYGLNSYELINVVSEVTFEDASIWKNYGMISTLNSVNDISYADDLWVACGDQSDAAPKDYSGGGKTTDLSGTAIEAYSGNGEAASYVNVCYWIDTNADANHKQTGENRNYQWKAVKISNEKYCNIVQVNCVNGMWIATGYLDADKDGEYDEGEQARIFWTYDPRLSCDEVGGWSDNVKLYDGTDELDLSVMGGINSCATRD